MQCGAIPINGCGSIASGRTRRAYRMNNTPDRFPRSVVIVQTGFLGDAVLASGMLRALRALDVARIGLVVRRDVASIFEGHPAITRLHALDKRMKGAARAMSDELRSEGYDVALIPHRSARTCLLVRRSAIPLRI